MTCGIEDSVAKVQINEGLRRVNRLREAGDADGLIAELDSPIHLGRLSVRVWAADALRRLGHPAGVPQLAARVGDDDLDMRLAAVRALAEIRDSRATPALVHALSDPSPVVRLRAVHGLHRLGDRSGLRTLIDLLELDDWLVRRSAAVQLGTLGEPGAIESLRVARARERPWRRRPYSQAIRRLRTRSTR